MSNIMSKLTGLADKAKLIAAAVLVFIIIACAVVIGVQGNTIESLQAINSRLAIERELALADLQAALGELDRQNGLISKHVDEMRAARAAADSEIARLRAQAGAVKTQVIEKLVKDSSCENQLRLIAEAQEGFYEK